MNALSSDLNISKDSVRAALNHLGLDENVRIEAIDMHGLVSLSDALSVSR